MAYSDTTTQVLALALESLHGAIPDQVLEGLKDLVTHERLDNISAVSALIDGEADVAEDR